MAAFWGAVLQCPWAFDKELGGVVETEHMFIFFQLTPKEHLSAGNRLHFDVSVDDMEAAADAAETLGATRTDERFDDPTDGGGYITMRDPEGNAFCFVCEPSGAWTACLRDALNRKSA